MSLRTIAIAMAMAMAVASAGDHPVTKVVDLLKKLSDQAVEEGKTEEVSFSKFKYWCSTSKSELAKAIEEEKATIDELKSSIEGLKQEKTALEDQVKELEGEIADLQAAAKSAKEKDEKRNKLYQDEKKDLQATVKAESNNTDAASADAGASSSEDESGDADEADEEEIEANASIHKRASKVFPGFQDGAILKYTINLNKTGEERLGVKIETDGVTVLIDSIATSGLVKNWNDENHIHWWNSYQVVRPGDRIVEVNGIRYNSTGMVDECKKNQMLTITFARKPSCENRGTCVQEAAVLQNKLAELKDAKKKAAEDEDYERAGKLKKLIMELELELKYDPGLDGSLDSCIKGKNGMDEIYAMHGHPIRYCDSNVRCNGSWCGTSVR